MVFIWFDVGDLSDSAIFYILPVFDPFYKLVTTISAQIVKERTIGQDAIQIDNLSKALNL